MTYKYRYIRRELYEANPAKRLKSFRSPSEISRLIRWPLWVMGIGGICLTVYLLWLLFTMPQSPLVPVLSVIVLFLSLAASFSREKLFYHLPAREKELAEQQRDYIEYLAGIRAVLIKHGIDGSEKLRKLKAECETLLKAREEKYARFHRVIIDMLISVPVAALITGLIYQDSGVVPVATASVLLLGLLVFGLAKLFSKIDYYSDGYFKDQNLLDAISEVEYAGWPFGAPGGTRTDGEEAQAADEVRAV